MRITLSTPIESEEGIDCTVLALEGFLGNVKNFVTRPNFSAYATEAAYLADKKPLSIKPEIAFDICLDPNYPFENIKKGKPNLIIVEEHQDPQSPDEITQEELDAINTNFDGQVLTVAQVTQYKTGDTEQLFYDCCKEFLIKTFELSASDITIS